MGRTYHGSLNESNTMKRTAIIKSIGVVLLTAILTLGAYFMIGPQITIIVPVAIVAGIIFAFRRSFISLVCFGYPLTFGLVSAYIGYAEIDDYTQTLAFAISIVIGLVGAVLIAAGLWKALSDRTTKKSNVAAE
jgi:1,4-dihydroxy-2-naphthoate octaprenyltransferase